MDRKWIDNGQKMDKKLDRKQISMDRKWLENGYLSNFYPFLLVHETINAVKANETCKIHL